MKTDPGSRASGKIITRSAIRTAAMRLFLEHGFDNVTTLQVARAAAVSPATLFNYFDTKEDLFFGQVAELEQTLEAVVRSCQPGQSILRALQAHVLSDLTAGRSNSNPAAVAPFHRQILFSARLRARETDIFRRRETVLRHILANALGVPDNSLYPRAAAAMFVAAEQVVANELRDRLAGAASPEQQLRDIEPFIAELFDLMQDGLGPMVFQPPDHDGPSTA